MTKKLVKGVEVKKNEESLGHATQLHVGEGLMFILGPKVERNTSYNFFINSESK